MAKKRGPKTLRFHALLNSLSTAVGQIHDHRQRGKVNYSLDNCYRSAFAMFYLQDPSVLAFQRRLQDARQKNNLTTLFGVETIPSDSQLRDVIDAHDYSPLLTVYRDWFQRLQRSKQLEPYRYLDRQYIISLDGSQYFSSENINCKRCLSTTKGNKRTEYYHQILQAAVVHPDRREVIPLAPEFIRRQDGTNKQDCETVAGLRAIRKIRAEHRQLPAVLVGDALYATETMIAEARKNRFSFLFGVKPGSHKSLFEDVEGLRKGDLLERHERRTEKGRRYLYEWSSSLPLKASSGSPIVNYVELHIYNEHGKRTRHFSWVTDLPVNAENVERIVRAARARWKIENENFNTLKNHGYHLEHNFGHGQEYLSEAFFVLNTLSFFMHQIFAISDRLYQRARECFSSRREFWNIIRGGLQLMVFSTWDELLERICSPP
jgi:hypothetical protein